MGVYRGGKPKDKQPPAKSSTPAGSGLTGSQQPRLRQRDAELAALNEQRQRHGHDPLVDPSTPTSDDDSRSDGDGEEAPAGDDDGSFYRGGRGEGLAASGSFYHGRGDGSQGAGNLGQQALRVAKSQAGKRAALAASGLFGPIVIAGIVLLFALEAGLPTEQVAQAVIGVRFSRLHGQMAKRLNHTKGTFRLWSTKPDADVREIHRRPRRGRQPLVLKLFGVDDVKIDADLRRRGYDLKYERRLGGLGPKRLVSIADKDGKTVFDRNNRNLRSLGHIRALGGDITGNNWRGRLLARRSIVLLAKDAGFRLTRFRNTLDKIRQRIRGPPVAASEIRQDMAIETIEKKQGVRRRLGLFRVRIAGLFDIGDGEIEDVGKSAARQSSDVVDRRGRLIRSKLVEKLGGPDGFAGRLSRGAVKASIGVLIATMFCTAFQIVSIVRDLAKLKIFQYMDTAAAILTSSSQMKAGNTSYAVINNLNHQFEGFGSAVTYQALHDRDSVRGYDFGDRTGEMIKEINRRFGIKSTFGVLFKALNGFISAVTTVLDFGLSKAPYPISLAMRIMRLSNAEALMKKVCGIVLNPYAQIAVAVLLGLAEFALAFVTGGITVVIGAIVKAVLFAVAVEGIIRATNLEEAAMNHLMPEAVAIASGAQSALTGGPTPTRYTQANSGGLGGLASAFVGLARAETEPVTHGADNYLKVDYGAFYLSQAQALGEGGGPIDRATAVAQDKVYLAQHRQKYADQGIWANIANPRNPYSLVARIQSWLPSQPLRTSPGQIRSVAGWLAGKPASWIGSAQANSLSDDELAALLYPDQEVTYSHVNLIGGGTVTEIELESIQVVGFHEAEVVGAGMFDFITNSEYVEEHLGNLKATYSECLMVDIGDFSLHQAGITQIGGYDYYPEKCTDPDARRYMIYYQDCQNVETLARLNSNTSPMLADDCDDLLPNSYLAELGELREAGNSSTDEDLRHGDMPYLEYEADYCRYHLYQAKIKPKGLIDPTSTDHEGNIANPAEIADIINNSNTVGEPEVQECTPPPEAEDEEAEDESESAQAGVGWLATVALKPNHGGIGQLIEQTPGGRRWDWA